MRFISTKVHGYLDYIVGVLLIAAPWLFGFYAGGLETWIPVVIGAGTIIMALFTDYELGAKRVLSMRVHLNMDLLAGILLALSPWLFNFAHLVFWPHLIVGILEIGAALFTRQQAYGNTVAANRPR